MMEPNENMYSGLPENIKTPEAPTPSWETMILLQRHGKYDSGRPADYENPTEEEKRTLGRLTPESRSQVVKESRNRLRELLAKDSEQVDFLVINSPTYWLDHKELGQRARETAEIVSAEISGALKERNLPETHLLNKMVRKTEVPAFKGKDSRPAQTIEETQMFQAPAFTEFLRQESGGQGDDFWANYYQDAYKEEREKFGAEGPKEMAERMNQFLNLIARFSRRYHKDNPGRKLVPWIVSHGEVMETYAHQMLGIPMDDFEVDYNDVINIAIDDTGKASTEIEGIRHEVKFLRLGEHPKIQQN